MTNPTACREAFEKWYWSEIRDLSYSQARQGWEACWATIHTEVEAVACWSLAHMDGGGPLFADCIYDNKEDAQLDADALNGEHGDLVPVPLYTHPRATSDEVERLRALVNAWRFEHCLHDHDAYSDCADELEATLAKM